MGKRIIYQDFSTGHHANAADCPPWIVNPQEDEMGLSDEQIDLSCATALVLAYDVATTPARIMLKGPADPPVVCGEDGNTPRPLQVYAGHTLVERAVRTALAAGIRSVTVLGPADPEALEMIAEALRGVRHANKRAKDSLWQASYRDSRVDIVSYDSTKAEQCRLASRNFELYGISEYVLEVGRDIVRGVADTSAGVDRLYVLACDQPRIEPHHLAALCERMDTMPKCEVVTSWITWLRRTPLLIGSGFLAGLDARISARSQMPAPFVPLEQIEVSEVVFGEEMLATNPTQPTAFEKFFSQCTLSALGAVRVAQGLRAKDADERSSCLAKLNDADRLLVESADVIARSLDASVQDGAPSSLEAHLAFGGEFETLAEQLKWADDWGRRNRVDFPIFAKRAHRDTLVYLDSAATTQRADAAIEAQRTFDTEENANVYRGGYDLSMQATYTLNDARAVLEKFIGAKRRETVYTQNTTGGANLVAQAWGDVNVQAGDLIVTSIAEHHSNMLPWMLLAERRGARIAYLPLDNAGCYDQEAYCALLQQHPRLVALAMCGNVLGMNAPVREMAQAAHAVGAVVFVDGAQGLPHKRVQVSELGCDFFAFSGHKMYGPLGIGGVWIHPDRLAEMRPVALGGGTVSHVGFGSYYLRLGAIAYENGTPPISQAVGLAGAIEYLDLLGMDSVEQHAALLTRYLMMGLRTIDGITVWGDHDNVLGQSGLVSLNVAGILPSPTGVYLGKLGVAVRSGGHCALPLAASLGVVGTTRISIGVYNTCEDIQAALTALRVLSVLSRER